MAHYPGDQFDRRHWRSRHTRSPSPVDRGYDSPDDLEWEHHSLPHSRRMRRPAGQDIFPRSADATIPPLRPSRTVWSDCSPAQQLPDPDMAIRTPALTRFATTGSTAMPVNAAGMSASRSTRRGKESSSYPPYDDEDVDDEQSRYQSGSRSHGHKGLRKDASPPSTRHYRSTPESRDSRKTSVVDSENDESDITVSTQDDRARNPGRKPARKIIASSHRSVEPDPAAAAAAAASASGHLSPEHKPRRRRFYRKEIIYEYDTDGNIEVEEDEGEEGEDDEGATPRRLSPERHEPRSHRMRPVVFDRDVSPHHASEVLRSGGTARHATPRRSNSVVEEPISRRIPVRRRHSENVQDERQTPPRRHRDPSGSRMSAGSSRKPVKRAQCLLCMADVPSDGSAKMKCGHRMCNRCLKQHFKASVKDPRQMPPTCCTDMIPLKHVEGLFSDDFKRLWDQKFFEFSTSDRVYCASKKCRELIRPDNIHYEGSRKCGKCSKCKTKVCCTCHGKWHGSRGCPYDEETNRKLQQARELGWQRCYRCKETTELKESSSHMTCLCGARFCTICGMKWKKCECPWFACNSPEEDLREEEDSHSVEYEALERHGSHLSARRSVTRASREPSGPPPNAVRRQPLNYRDEMQMRRLHERQDSGGSGPLARRPQHSVAAHHNNRSRDFEEEEEEGEDDDFDDDFDELHDYDAHDDEYPNQTRELVGYQSTADYYMNDEYRRGTQNGAIPTNVPTPPPPPAVPPPPPAVTPPGSKYAAGGSSRHKGKRADSLERRLASRFSENRQAPREATGSVPMMMGQGPAPYPGFHHHHNRHPSSPHTAPQPHSPRHHPPMTPTHSPMHSISMISPGSAPGMSGMRGPIIEEEMHYGSHPPPPHPRGNSHAYPSHPRSLRPHAVPTVPMAPEMGMPFPDVLDGGHPRGSPRRRRQYDAAPSSAQAGLSGLGGGHNRVFEWSTYVEPTAPEAEALNEGAKAC